ncbi:syntaxin-8-like [Daphnia pulicaria]|uniref:syntaxin-8-like n=1 Tax=Daphnia pulicaria TaxID=35523 RepID=UPI001EE9C57D|nr:syntaxin-8-like [Daphnia pulicaria]
MALVDLGNDANAWEKEFSSAEKLHFSLLGILNERDHLPKNSQAHARLSFQLRNSLSQLYSEIQSLKGHLEHLSQNKQLTAREKERRGLLLEDLLSKHKQLLNSVNSSVLDKSQSLSKLSSGTTASSNPLSSAMTSEHIPHRELKQIQVQIMADQDRGLDELSRIIGRQRQIAQTIGDEVESQNDLIENIADNVDRTRDRMAQQTSTITVVDRKDRTFGYWMVILLLFVAIVVVASIPKH